VAGRLLNLYRINDWKCQSWFCFVLAVFRPFYFINEVPAMKKNRRAYSKHNPGTKSGRCPYCCSPIILRSADGIYRENSSNTMLYACTRYPACDAYVRVIPGSKNPVGTMANGPLRALRKEAHQYFDLIHQTGIMTRDDAYAWLAAIIQAPATQAHIGLLGDYYCRQVIEESKRLLENRRRAHGRPEYQRHRISGGGIHAAK
jgi:hypothetical protein